MGTLPSSFFSDYWKTQTITTEDNYNKEFYKVPWEHMGGAANSDLGDEGKLPKGSVISAENWASGK